MAVSLTKRQESMKM